MLMRLYPQGFRSELGDSIEQTFRDLLRDAFRRRGYAGVAQLWFRIVPDFIVSLWESLTLTSSDYLQSTFRLRWILACAIGSTLSLILGQALEGLGVFAFLVSQRLPERWTLAGLPFFLCIGLLQAFALTPRLCHPRRWVCLTMLAGVVGVVLAAALPVEPKGPPGFSGLLLLFTREALTAFVVGSAQWRALKQTYKSDRWSVVCMGSAYAATLLSFGLHATANWIGGLPAMIYMTYLGTFVAGGLFGLLSSGPLKNILWRNTVPETGTT
jgi:hypothetical protein